MNPLATPRRRSGVLAHLTSLPGYVERGALGSESRRFVEFLAAAGCSVWQMLPVNPADAHGSPYQSCCSDAGDPRCISLAPEDLGFAPATGPVEDPDRLADLTRLLSGFETLAAPERRAEFAAFAHAEAAWLTDYARYRVLKQRFDNHPWVEWPQPLRDRSPATLQTVDSEHAATLQAYRFQQYLFFTQWRALRDYAAANGVVLFGDLPMFVAHDSVEVWAHRDHFQLDGDGRSAFVAGVPPDYFSADGQLWGTPLYDWESLAAESFGWWIARIRHQLSLFDLVRLDHFRGFCGVWAVPGGHATAEHGQWRAVPGAALFGCLREAFESLPLVAEDLGSITEDVLKLREDMALPGIKVLQFAFDSDAANPYLPHNHVHESLVCTGTHDNNTTLGWYTALDEGRRGRILDYCGHPQEPMPLPLIRVALASIGRLAVIPLQDWLGLGGEHRLNTPGTVEGNWAWRFAWDWLSPELVQRMRHLNTCYGRS